MRSRVTAVFQAYPKVSRTLKTLTNIFVGLVTCVVFVILAKRLAEPIILHFFETQEVAYYALSGLVNLISILFAYVVFVKFYEKRPVVELNFAGRNMFYGIVAGMAIISITTISLFAIGLYEVTSYQEWSGLFLVLIALTSQAIAGEILFRGILFRITEQQLGTVYALVLISVLLGLLNIAVDGPDPMVLISIILIAALWCSIYVLSRNLWVVGLSYAAWLYAIFATGILDEHWRVSAPIVSSYSGPVVLTGGEFGPEHSILTVVLVSICLFWILKTARNKGLFIKR